MYLFVNIVNLHAWLDLFQDKTSVRNPATEQTLKVLRQKIQLFTKTMLTSLQKPIVAVLIKTRAALYEALISNIIFKNAFQQPLLVPAESSAHPHSIPLYDPL
jgi:hypothetical protein